MKIDVIAIYELETQLKLHKHLSVYSCLKCGPVYVTLKKIVPDYF